MSKSAPREIELKLRLTPEEMEAVLAGSALPVLREAPRRRRLRTVYWDTGDAALSRNVLDGTAFHVARCAGSGRHPENVEFGGQ